MRLRFRPTGVTSVFAENDKEERYLQTHPMEITSVVGKHATNGWNMQTKYAAEVELMKLVEDWDESKQPG
jgi:hypothetical protein